MFVAINAPQWSDGQVCGKCVSVKCIDPKCPTQGVAVRAQAVDKCPECKFGDIDMSYPLYKAVTGSWPNRLHVSWSWTDCGDLINGTIQLDPKDGTNPYFTAFYLSNSRYPIANVTIDGTPYQRQTFGFWTGGSLPPAPYTIAMTADNGQVVTVTVAELLKSQDLGVQFVDVAGGAGAPSNSTQGPPAPAAAG